MHPIQYDEALAAAYARDARFEHPIGRMGYAAWLEHLGWIAGNTALDLACGSGHTSRLLASRDAFVVGVDISPTMIAMARALEEARPLDIEYIESDAAILALGRVFDLVTPTYLLNYAENETMLALFAETIARHLRQGGRMVALNASDDPIVPRIENAQHSSEWVPGDVPYRDGSRFLFTLYDLRGEIVAGPITSFYWSRETYTKVLDGAGLVDITWHKIPMSDEARAMLPNWEELDKRNISTVITATKR